MSQCVQVEVVVTWTAWWYQKWNEIDGLGYIMELEVIDMANGMDMEGEESKGIWKIGWMVVPYCVKSYANHG